MIEDISPAEFVRRRTTDDRWQMIDVREPWEVAISSIEFAVLMPMGNVPERMAELDRHRPLAVMCHSGVRSRRVAEFLLTEGFQNLVNIAGGIDAWSVEIDETMARY